MHDTCTHDWKVHPAYDCETCMRHVSDSAVHMARRECRSDDDAYDVASEAIVEILRRQRFDPGRGVLFSTFLRHVVASSALTFYRAVKRANRNTAAAGPMHVRAVTRGRVTTATSHDLGASVREAEYAVMLGEVLSLLPAHDQRAFAMHLEGYSRAEIATSVLVNGRRLSPQRWSQRLRPIEDAVVNALGLLDRG